jgi:hypothetical protein
LFLSVGGTELTALASIPIGLRVVRGRNWWSYDGEKDGGAGNVGVIRTTKTENGNVWVMWSSGNRHAHFITSLATAPGETNREGRVKSKQNSLLPPLCIAF